MDSKQTDKQIGQDFYSELSEFRESFEKIKQKYQLSGAELFEEIETQVVIPCSIFTKELTILQTVCKYLRENLKIRNRDVGLMLNRDDTIIWATYRKARQKVPEKFTVGDLQVVVPVRILSNRQFSAFENIVMYLKEQHGMKYVEIASLLKRDERTIWTVYKRAMVKRNEK